MTDASTYLLRVASPSAPQHIQQLRKCLQQLDASPTSQWQRWLAQNNQLTVGQPYRTLLIAETTDSLRQQLTEAIEQPAPANPNEKIGFLFTGQGAQRPCMAQTLYTTFPIFQQIIDHCHEILSTQYDIPLLQLLTSEDPADHGALNQTGATQPALFSYEVALAALWESGV